MSSGSPVSSPNVSDDFADDSAPSGDLDVAYSQALADFESLQQSLLDDPYPDTDDGGSDDDLLLTSDDEDEDYDLLLGAGRSFLDPDEDAAGSDADPLLRRFRNAVSELQTELSQIEFSSPEELADVPSIEAIRAEYLASMRQLKDDENEADQLDVVVPPAVGEEEEEGEMDEKKEDNEDEDVVVAEGEDPFLRRLRQYEEDEARGIVRVFLADGDDGVGIHADEKEMVEEEEEEEEEEGEVVEGEAVSLMQNANAANPDDRKKEVVIVSCESISNQIEDLVKQVQSRGGVLFEAAVSSANEQMEQQEQQQEQQQQQLVKEKTVTEESERGEEEEEENTRRKMPSVSSSSSTSLSSFETNEERKILAALEASRRARKAQIARLREDHRQKVARMRQLASERRQQLLDERRRREEEEERRRKEFAEQMELERRRIAIEALRREEILMRRFVAETKRRKAEEEERIRQAEESRKRREDLSFQRAEEERKKVVGEQKRRLIEMEWLRQEEARKRRLEEARKRREEVERRRKMEAEERRREDLERRKRERERERRKEKVRMELAIDRIVRESRKKARKEMGKFASSALPPSSSSVLGLKSSLEQWKADEKVVRVVDEDVVLSSCREFALDSPEQPQPLRSVLLVALRISAVFESPADFPLRHVFAPCLAKIDVAEETPIPTLRSALGPCCHLVSSLRIPAASLARPQDLLCFSSLRTLSFPPSSSSSASALSASLPFSHAALVALLPHLVTVNGDAVSVRLRGICDSEVVLRNRRSRSRLLDRIQSSVEPIPSVLDLLHSERCRSEEEEEEKERKRGDGDAPFRRAYRDMCQRQIFEVSSLSTKLKGKSIAEICDAQESLAAAHLGQHDSFPLSSSGPGPLPIVREAVRDEEQIRHEAAVTIQRFLRGVFGGSRREARNAAALKIQRVWRGCRCRRRIGPWARRKAEGRHLNATRIQAWWRGNRARRVLNQARELDPLLDFELESVGDDFFEEIRSVVPEVAHDLPLSAPLLDAAGFVPFRSKYMRQRILERQKRQKEEDESDLGGGSEKQERQQREDGRISRARAVIRDNFVSASRKNPSATAAVRSSGANASSSRRSPVDPPTEASPPAPRKKRLTHEERIRQFMEESGCPSFRHAELMYRRRRKSRRRQKHTERQRKYNSSASYRYEVFKKNRDTSGSSSSFDERTTSPGTAAATATAASDSRTATSPLFLRSRQPPVVGGGDAESSSSSLARPRSQPVDSSVSGMSAPGSIPIPSAASPRRRSSLSRDSNLKKSGLSASMGGARRSRRTRGGGRRRQQQQQPQRSGGRGRRRGVSKSMIRAAAETAKKSFDSVGRKSATGGRPRPGLGPEAADSISDRQSRRLNRRKPWDSGGGNSFRDALMRNDGRAEDGQTVVFRTQGKRRRR